MSGGNLWAVPKREGGDASGGGAACATNFIYGRVPTGYEMIVPAKSLTQSTFPEVIATGTGPNASKLLVARQPGPLT